MRRVLAGALAALLMFAAAGYSMANHHNWSFNLNPDLRQLDTAVRSHNPYRSKCFGANNAFRNNDACTLGSPRKNGSFDMVVLGDSHADHFVPTMALLAKKAGLSGRQVTVGGCLALLGYYNRSPYRREGQCPELREAMVRFVDRNPGLQLAVLAHRWSVYNGLPFTDGERERTLYLLASPGDERSARRSGEVLRNSLEQTLDFLQSRGIKVLLMGEVPPPGRDPSRCLARAIKQGLPLEPCGRAEKEATEEISQANALLAEQAAKRKNVTFFSPTPFMCKDGWCNVVRDGIYIFRDSTHLTWMGAELLADHIQLPIGSPAN